MPYAQLAGLPAITGLYTTFLCLVGYALLGPSRLRGLGPDSSLAPMIAATLLPIRRLECKPGASDRARLDAPPAGRSGDDRGGCREARIRRRPVFQAERYELVGPLDPAHVLPTPEAAVAAFRQQTGADWQRLRRPAEMPG